MAKDVVNEPSERFWASPVVLVEKKNKTLRFWVYYRKLNSVNKREAYPLPLIDDALDRLRKSK